MKYDIIIIGGGIIGLATGLQLKKRKPSLRMLLLEKEQQLASHQTGHNSGVIHSGLYYETSSLKAQNCAAGYQQLLRFCDEEGIPYEISGKIVIATQQHQMATLHELYRRGTQNGLKGLKKLTKEEITAYEPYVNGLAGIFVPQTGIIDFKQVALRYAEHIQQQEGSIVLGEKVIDIRLGTTTHIITESNAFEGKVIINCAGLYADKIAELTQPTLPYKVIPFRGEYYKLREDKRYLVRNLVYPVPDPRLPFLGVHFTRRINGEIEAGPNAILAFKREGYTKKDVSWEEFLASIRWPGFQKVALKYWKTGLKEIHRSFSKKAFTKALQQLVPAVQEDDLVVTEAGVRAQACDRKGNLIDDFLLLVDKNVIHIGNAPSPAATASLSIGETVAKLALKHLER
ncbi:MAG: L-2-hydroxyglutarate oxidase [Cytophagales bacterium]|nr:L-2-hydroxyglutarate oxidase [Cytophagales bacterium]